MKYQVLAVSIINAVCVGVIAFLTEIAFNGGMIDDTSLPKAAIIGLIIFFGQLTEVLKSFKKDLVGSGKRLGMIFG